MRSEKGGETEIATRMRPTSSRRVSEREREVRMRKGERARRGENWKKERERRKRREEDRRRVGVAEIVRARWNENLPLCGRRRDSEDGKGGGGVVTAVLDWRTNARETVARNEPARRGARMAEEGGERGNQWDAGAHGRTGWMGAGTVFKRKEKERGESSEWLVHY